MSAPNAVAVISAANAVSRAPSYGWLCRANSSVASKYAVQGRFVSGFSAIVESVCRCRVSTRLPVGVGVVRAIAAAQRDARLTPAAD
jgi:hypothetical protein